MKINVLIVNLKPKDNTYFVEEIIKGDKLYESRTIVIYIMDTKLIQ